MKIFKELKQGSDEWKEFRHGKIGGSTAGKIMTKLDKPVTECAEFYQILAENMEDFDPFTNDYISFDMQRGNELEPLAREEYERIYDVKVEQFGWIEQDNNWIGISPDGWMPELKKAIEIKCPAANTHVKYMLNKNEFFEDYVWQIVHNFLVLEIDSIDCISYRPENRYCSLVVNTVTLDTEIKISAKITKKVSELVEMEKIRLNELRYAIDKELILQNSLF